jgi:hypothetical protein
MIKPICSRFAAGIAALFLLSLLFTREAKASPPPSWTQLSEDNSNVDFYFIADTCTEENVVFIKVINTSSSAQSLSFSLSIQEEDDSTKSETVSARSVTVPASTTISGGCIPTALGVLYIRMENEYSSPVLTLTLN